MTLVVRTSGDPATLIAPVRSVIKGMDARLPISEVRTMREVVNTAIAGPRFAMQALGLFGAVALLVGDRDLRHRVAGGRVARARIRNPGSARRDAG
jgi:hypothetical protein